MNPIRRPRRWSSVLVIFSVLVGFIVPGVVSPPARAASSLTCVESAFIICMLNSRFEVRLRFRPQFNDNPVNTNAFRKPVTGFANPNFETGFFYFNSPDNIEVMVKILDQGNTNPQGQPTIALLYGTATPLRTELIVLDTKTGAQRTYTTAFNTQRGQTDFTAFVK